MDIDRFWNMIDQARAAAGPEADRAIRDFDDADPNRDFWDGSDLRNEAWIADQLAEMFRAEHPVGATEPADADTVDDDDDDDDDELDDEDDIVDPVALGLLEQLVELPAGEIGEFDNRFEEIRAAADTPALIVAAQLIEHGMLGDDGFDDFRAGLVALGRATFEVAVVDPDSLADHPLVREIAEAADPRWLGREDMIFVASHAYATVTGEEEITFFEYAESMRDLANEPAEKADEDDESAERSEAWDLADEAETRRRLPRLSELFYVRSMQNRQRVLDHLKRPL